MIEPRNPRVALSALALSALLVVAAGCGGEAPAPEPGAAAGGASEPAATPTRGPAGPTGTASVTGTVSYEGQLPRLRSIDMAADPVCAGKHEGAVLSQVLVLGDGNTLGNVFLKISEGVPEGNYPAPSEPAVIDQQGCLYDPRVIGVMAGQELEFLNSDAILHNVHGLPEQNREFNLGMPANLTEKSVTLNEPEPLFPVKCDVHPWMNAYVAVMSHPFWAITGEDGSYAIESLPAGSYTVEAWHERLGTQTTQITVAEGESAGADFTFSPPSGG